MTLVEFMNKVGFIIDEKSVSKVNSTIKDIKSTATKMLGAIGIGLSLTAINALVDEFDAANKQIKTSVGELENMTEVQDKVLAKANEARLAYKDMAGYVSNLVKAGPDIFPVDDAVQFASTVAKLMKTNGRNDSQIASMMEGLNKSFQKGIIDSETLNKMLEQAPEMANALADSLGVAKSKLLDMASNGKMTVQQLKAAFMDSSGAIDVAFFKTNMSVSDGLKSIRNKWGLWLTQMNDTLGVTNTIARGMVKLSDTVLSGMNRIRNGLNWLGDKLGGTDKVLKTLIITVSSFLAVTQANKIVKFLDDAKTKLDKVGEALGKIHLKQIRLMAALIIIALLVEDFINFLQGNDSLFGAILEKAGVDVEKFRTNLIQIWSNIKAALGGIWQGIKDVASSMFGALRDILKAVFDSIGGALSKVAPQFADFLDKLANGKVDVEMWKQIGHLIGGIGGTILTVVTAIKLLTAAWSAAKAVIGGVSVAMKAIPAIIGLITSPAGAVVIVLMAIGAVIYLLIKHWDEIKEKTIEIWGKIKDFISNTVSFLKEFIPQAWENIKNKVATFVSEIWEKITATFERINHAIGEKILSIQRAIANGVGVAIDWIKGLPAQAVQWGADIIQGIVDGIKGAVGKVGEAVKGVADKIKSFLHFSKPDEGPLSDFDTYMPDMIDLMVKGITAGRGKVRGALEALTSGMALVANIGTATPATAAATAGGTSVSRSIVQNVNINNRFEGDRAGQQKSAAAMKKASGDTTSELARGLAYVK